MTLINHERSWLAFDSLTNVFLIELQAHLFLQKIKDPIQFHKEHALD